MEAQHNEYEDCSIIFEYDGKQTPKTGTYVNPDTIIAWYVSDTRYNEGWSSYYPIIATVEGIIVEFSEQSYDRLIVVIGGNANQTSKEQNWPIPHTQ